MTRHRYMTIPLSLVIIASASVTIAQGSPGDFAATPDYFYDATGARDLVASDHEFVVGIKASARAVMGERPRFLPMEIKPESLPPAAADLEDRLTQRGVFVARGVTRIDLEGFDEVAYVLPVLYRVGCDVPIYPTNRLVARLRDSAAYDELAAIAAENGAEIAPAPGGLNRFVLTVTDCATTSPIALANSIHERADLVHYAAPDFFLPKITQAPDPIDDPWYALQWHLDGDIDKGADPGSDINAESAWDTAYGITALGSPTVRVSIIDDSVEKFHPDLYSNWWTGLDLDVDPWDDDPSPDSGGRHGTACAGVAVAAANNIGVRGSCPACGLIGIRFFGSTDSETAYAYLFSMDPNQDGSHDDGAAVMSNSWSYADGTLLPAEVANAINTAATTGRDGLGCLILFAAGNNDHTVNGVSALAQMANTIAVGGTNSHAQHTEFSDVGPEIGIATPTNDRGDDGVRFGWLDITTTDNTGESGYNGLPDLDYTNGFGGTSSATPLAAGVFGLVISQDETMSAAQARAIVQHTATHIDEPYGRFDTITGHSHRYGYGRADLGAAMAAAGGGIRWPDRIRTFQVTPTVDQNIVSWTPPTGDYDSSVLVRGPRPFAWAPTDGQDYVVGQEVAPQVFVVYVGWNPTYSDVGATDGAFFYAAYPRSTDLHYGFGAKGHTVRDAITVFYDSSEGVDPGWTHDGPGDEWGRGTPTSGVSIFGQAVYGSGPLAGTRGVRAIGGNRCWGTDLASTYNASADTYLQTPLLNLTGVTAPAFLEYYDWCLLETYYDRCTVEVVDENESFLGYLDPDTGGDYDWTYHIHDLTPFAGQSIKIRFRLQSDGVLQRDGWFIDEVRVMVAGGVALPPTVEDVYVETTENTPVSVYFIGQDPNPGTVLQYTIESLPTNGELTDPGTGLVITGVPCTLVADGNVVQYTPALDYQGPDEFTFRAFDGGQTSNIGTATLSVGTANLIYDYPLTTDPGWLTQGQWAWGVPMGNGGDPTTGYTGIRVYGYNLYGAYEDDLPPTHLTTLPFNCAGLSRVTLSFARWLGVEAASYDSASIEASTNGVDWQTVWRHRGTSDLEETSWSLQSYNISAIADGAPFVQLRWTMGPTDGSSNFAGWNIDDVQISAIGTTPDNQPPYATPLASETARNHATDVQLLGTDVDEDPLTFTIVQLPANGQLEDPLAGVITAVPYVLASGGSVVTYTPDPGFTGADYWAYMVTDGQLESNVAGVDVEILDPAAFPYVQDFEGPDPLAHNWQLESTNVGRIRVAGEFQPIGAYHVVMDSGAESSYSLNQMTLVIDLEGESSVLLRYDWKELSDESHTLPNTWQGSAEGDGVAISADGNTWHKVADLIHPDDASVYLTSTIDLDRAAANAGISYNRTFRIRFQQYDNNPADADGIAVDNIQVLQGTDDPLITTAVLPSGMLGVPYGPVSVAAAGGDPPLVWSLLLRYFDTDLGENLFAPTTGVAQGIFGDDVVFDYTLPFAFPFYGELETDVKIATDGWINFGNYVGSTYGNSEVLLRYNRRIAVLWDDQTTEGGGDIYIDESVPGQVTFRWSTLIGANPCAYSATLFDNGLILLDYGPGNTGLTPTVGVSSGDQQNYTLAVYDAAASLDGANSLLFNFTQLPPGLELDADGAITGTPTTIGTYYPMFHVQDAAGRTDEKRVPILIEGPAFGDYDMDQDVDVDDFFAFNDCMDAATPGAWCLAVFDDDGDGKITMRDFARFQREFGGSAADRAMLIDQGPPAGSSLWRPAGNIVSLTFDRDISIPAAEELLINEMVAGGGFGPDLAHDFQFTVEPDNQGKPRVLRVFQSSAAWQHRHWYAIRNTGGWAGVAPFTVQYLVQVGDTDDDGQTLNGDLAAILDAVPATNVGETDRRDVTGDGNIQTDDIDLAAQYVPSFTVEKPAGH